VVISVLIQLAILILFGALDLGAFNNQAESVFSTNWETKNTPNTDELRLNRRRRHLAWQELVVVGSILCGWIEKNGTEKCNSK
jgi:hypothetical protein